MSGLRLPPLTNASPNNSNNPNPNSNLANANDISNDINGPPVANGDPPSPVAMGRTIPISNDTPTKNARRKASLENNRDSPNANPNRGNVNDNDEDDSSDSDDDSTPLGRTPGGHEPVSSGMLSDRPTKTPITPAPQHNTTNASQPTSTTIPPNSNPAIIDSSSSSSSSTSMPSIPPPVMVTTSSGGGSSGGQRGARKSVSFNEDDAHATLSKENKDSKDNKEDDNKRQSSPTSTAASEMKEMEEERKRFDSSLSWLTLFVGTWNLHAKPPANLQQFIPPNEFDIYVIGTQECEKSIEKSLIMPSKAKWSKTLTELLGRNYIEIGQETLQAMHVIVFVRHTLSSVISKVETSKVKTGLGDVIGNKGGVAIGFDVGQTSFLFVSSHFHAHQHKVHERNEDFMKINTKLEMRNSTPGCVPLCTDRYQRVFWLGDLNYRVAGNRAMIDALIRQNMLEVMRSNDQLIAEMKSGRVFAGFTEAMINFPPTYKFDPKTDIYDSSKKQRIPSWTDRILYKSDRAVRIREYNSARTVRSSDHRPVFATFHCGYQPPDGVQPTGIGSVRGNPMTSIRSSNTAPINPSSSPVNASTKPSSNVPASSPSNSKGSQQASKVCVIQ